MNRGQMVEKAARAYWRAWYEEEPIDPGDLEAIKNDAAAVLDAILPQVSTVAELEALPIGTVLVSTAGTTWQINGDGKRKFARNTADGHRWMFSTRLYSADPLTVVWTPEGEA